MEEVTNIEFEFFQAAPREEKQIFIPQGMPEENSPEISDPSEISTGIIKTSTAPPSVSAELDWDEPFEEDPLAPSLEEQKAVYSEEEKTSQSLETNLLLEEIKQSEQVKWDYCNRIRALIESHAKLPESLANLNITDVVKVEITIDRQGKLVSGTPRIMEYSSSKYPELNDAALNAVRAGSVFFPPLPERYKRDEITFELPIKFISIPSKKDL